ncbi:Holliday junction resolvase RuvX, partial [Lactobacillus ruminis]|nr:Holliday junction resolvase RuvX [Ligilactobacillus ruminis]
MGRIIAIDYGRKRTGIAATDILQMIANGVATVPSGEVV